MKDTFHLGEPDAAGLVIQESVTYGNYVMAVAEQPEEKLDESVTQSSSASEFATQN